MRKYLRRCISWVLILAMLLSPISLTSVLASSVAVNGNLTIYAGGDCTVNSGNIGYIDTSATGKIWAGAGSYWLKYSQVDFGNGFQQVAINTGNWGASITTVFRIDDNTTGAVIATISDMTSTGVSTPVDLATVGGYPVTGRHDLYVNITIPSDSADILDFEFTGAKPDSRTITDISALSGSVEKGIAFSLPTTVTANMSDSSTKIVPVVWNPTSIDTTSTGIKTAIGTVAGYSGQVVFTLTVTASLWRYYRDIDPQADMAETSLEFKPNEVDQPSKIWVGDSRWVKYSSIDFGSYGMTEVRLKYLTWVSTWSCHMKVYVDNMTSAPIGDFEIAPLAGGVKNWSSTLDFNRTVTGVHDIYVDFSAPQTAGNTLGVEIYDIQLSASADFSNIENRTLAPYEKNDVLGSSSGIFTLPSIIPFDLDNNKILTDLPVSWDNGETSLTTNAVGTQTATGQCILGAVIFHLNIAKEAARQVQIDATQTVKKLKGNEIGININHTYGKDIEVSDKVADSFNKLGVKTLRFAEGETGDMYVWDYPINGVYPDSYKTNKLIPLHPRVSVLIPGLGNKLGNMGGSGSIGWPYMMFPMNDQGYFDDTKALNFNDFMKLSKDTKATPFYIIGTDSGQYPTDQAGLEAMMGLGRTDTENCYNLGIDFQIQSAVALVKYAKANNFPMHYEIGNENDLTANGETWTAEEYGKIVSRFSKAMKAADPSVKIGYNSGFKGADDTSWLVGLQYCQDDVDYLAIHQYGTSMSSIQCAQNSLTTLAQQGTITTENSKKYKFNVTEWNANGARETPISDSLALDNVKQLYNMMIVPQMESSIFWVNRWGDPNNTTSSFNAVDPNGDPNTMGLSLKVFADTLLDKIVSTNYSETNKDINVYASMSTNNKNMTVYIVNKNNYSKDADITFTGFKPSSSGNEKWVFKGDSLASTSMTWSKEGSVTIGDNGKISVALDSASVTVLKLEYDNKNKFKR